VCGKSALGIPPTDKKELKEFIGILDPDGEGYASFPSFVAICGLKMRARDDTDDDAAHQAELQEAFELVANGKELITVQSLQRVARLLGEELTDALRDLMCDMILVANDDGQSLADGVNIQQFDHIMHRAGVWKSARYAMY
jgi:hypothetical protein